MPSRKYLTEEKFNEFLTNDFGHLQKVVAYIRGQMKVLIPLVIAVIGLLGLILALLVGLL